MPSELTSRVELSVSCRYQYQFVLIVVKRFDQPRYFFQIRSPSDSIHNGNQQTTTPNCETTMVRIW